MTRTVFVAGSLVAAALALSGCSGTTSGSGSAPEAPAAPETSQDAQDPAAPGLSGEDFLAQAASLSGSMVTLGRCSLLTAPNSDGTMACRVLDKQGADIKDDKGLPVDIFIKPDDFSSDDEAVVAECGGFCEVQITGKLDRATDGTGYLSMTDVSLQTLG